MTLPAVNVSFYKVILHNRNTYLPGFHKVFGSEYLTTPITSGRNEERRQVSAIILSKTWNNYLDKGGDRSCQEKEDVNMEKCVEDYLSSAVGCR